MNNKKFLTERKAVLKSEALAESPLAKRGALITRICLLSILLPRIILSLLEIIYYSVEKSPSMLYIPFLVLIVMLTAYLVHEGGKGFTYVLLIGAILRLIVFLSLIYPAMPADAFKETYAFILFAILIIQFAASIVMLTNSRCDAYFTMLQRITIKVHGEIFIRERKSGGST